MLWIVRVGILLTWVYLLSLAHMVVVFVFCFCLTIIWYIPLNMILNIESNNIYNIYNIYI